MGQKRVLYVRLDEGHDGDIITWLNNLPAHPPGLRGQFIKDALRRGIGLEASGAQTSGTAAVDPDALSRAMEQVLDRFLVEMRRVVEAALESAGSSAGREPEAQTDEGRALLEDFLSGLSLGEDTP